MVMGQSASLEVWTLEFGTVLTACTSQFKIEIEQIGLLQLPELSAVLSLLCASGGCYLLN